MTGCTSGSQNAGSRQRADHLTLVAKLLQTVAVQEFPVKAAHATGLGTQGIQNRQNCQANLILGPDEIFGRFVVGLTQETSVTLEDHEDTHIGLKCVLLG
ncbi:MAG TPA: hypothetical protein ENK41_05065, partial [Rhodobacteraceae bacterium]|nr:hypothetical protein [Paracoccaceae bacterium]